MKKFKLSLLAITAVSALVFSACSSDSVLETRTEPMPVIPQEKVTPKLVFQFSFPVTDNRIAFTRALGSPIQDGDEAGVQSLWMYEFEARSGAKISATNIFGDLTNSGTYTYTYNQASGYTDSRARRFVFIANDAAERSITNISDLLSNTSTEEVEKKLVAGTIAAPTANSTIWQTINTENVLPMTGEAIRNGNNIIAIDSISGAQTVNVDLTRTVARIDVRNYTPDLTITDLKLIKTNGTSWIMPHLEADGKMKFFTQTKVDNIGTTVPTSPTPFTDDYNATGTVGDAGHDATEAGFLRKAFYVYEDSTTTAADRLTLQVRGYVGNVNVFYNIPFSKEIAVRADGTSWAQYDLTNSTTRSTEPVSIKRNNIYTVEIGDGNPINIHTNVRATIKVKNWDTQEVNETFNPDLFVYDGNLLSGSASTDNVWYHTSSQILDVPNTAIDSSADPNLKIKVSDNYSNLVITAVEVLASNTTDSEAWLTATLAADNKSFNITTLANGNNKPLRSRSIKVTYTITPTGGSPVIYTTVFTVRQAAGPTV